MSQGEVGIGVSGCGHMEEHQHQYWFVMDGEGVAGGPSMIFTGHPSFPGPFSEG